ncbi:DUF1489 family protein [Paracoccus sp. S-4012]|uniref:DUF1489 family protein n=1 Tax=Paracoccus sp. S-4012 TaxID=2665648 RepID=UPI0012B0C7C0|nr:DUF1489 domain-containing protein [Paracoccus sp. S-4012]MRX51431.1 DUF1489 family protein [Paracoccus sp. S-4012]
MPHPLNLMKLCVGCPTPAELTAWQSRFGDGPAVHVTRMWPTRQAELLEGGSIYWVFKGIMAARQRLIGLEERIGPDGIRRCALILDREVVPVAAVPRRPFQGWRYLRGEDAPADLPKDRAAEPSLPPKLMRELAAMGLR